MHRRRGAPAPQDSTTKITKHTKEVAGLLVSLVSLVVRQSDFAAPPAPARGRPPHRAPVVSAVFSTANTASAQNSTQTNRFSSSRAARFIGRST